MRKIFPDYNDPRPVNIIRETLHGAPKGHLISQDATFCTIPSEERGFARQNKSPPKASLDGAIRDPPYFPAEWWS